MKKLLLLFTIVFAGTLIHAQSSATITNLNGKFGFIYKDQKRMVELIASSNTFIEYDEKGNQLTDGSFVKKGDRYFLTPIVTSNGSQINIPVDFIITSNRPKN